MDDRELAGRIESMTPTLFRICYAQFSDLHDREDAVQEALLRVWHRRDSIRDERFLQTFVVRTLLNVCRDMQRKSRRIQPSDALPEPSQPYDPSHSRVHDALLSLDEKHRTPILLHYMEGYPVEDVAKILRIPVGTVKTRLRCGREKLKKLLIQNDRRWTS